MSIHLLLLLVLRVCVCRNNYGRAMVDSEHTSMPVSTGQDNAVNDDARILTAHCVRSCFLEGFAFTYAQTTAHTYGLVHRIYMHTCACKPCRITLLRNVQANGMAARLKGMQTTYRRLKKYIQYIYIYATFGKL